MMADKIKCFSELVERVSNLKMAFSCGSDGAVCGCFGSLYFCYFCWRGY